MPTRLREVMSRPGIIVTPGIYDGLSARMVAQAGFEVAVVSGAAVSASTLGVPDLGIITLSEMAERVRDMVAVAGIPVIADGEAGFGGVQNVVRTVSSFERAGVAGIILEDQTENKKCGHFKSKSVVPRGEAVLKIKAAVRARENSDLLIMARTDALAIEGMDAAITRARAFAEAGADALFVEAATTDAQLEEIPARLADLGLPIWANMAEGAMTPMHSANELEKMGYKWACYPGGIQKIMVKVIGEYLQSLRATGSVAAWYPSRMASLAERSAVLRLDDYLQFEADLIAED